MVECYYCNKDNDDEGFFICNVYMHSACDATCKERIVAKTCAKCEERPPAKNAFVCGEDCASKF